MRAASDIPFSRDDVALIGEFSAIMGLVDEQMTRTVSDLLKVDRQAANVILGSSKSADNCAISAQVISNRTGDEDILWLVEHAEREMQTVSTDRNDFIHAIFIQRYKLKPPASGQDGTFALRGISFGPTPGDALPAVVRRVRHAKERPLAD